MASIMSDSVDSLPDASWHPALRPENSLCSEDGDTLLNQNVILHEEKSPLFDPYFTRAGSQENSPLNNQPTATVGDEILSNQLSLLPTERGHGDVNGDETKLPENPEQSELPVLTSVADKPNETIPANSQTTEFSWGDETNPWDITASQDPFHRPEIIERTNSFPAVSQNSTAQTEYRADLSGSHDLLLPSQTNPLQNGSVNLDGGRLQELFWDDSQVEDGEIGGDEFFGQLRTQTKPIYIPPEADSRFEEGLPLVYEEEPSEEPAALEKIFDDEADDADDFFKASDPNGTPAIPSKPLHPTRKSTSQVLNSFDLTVPDSPVDDFFAKEPQNEFIPEDKTIISEPPVEDDLAARWQAELSDDDDLLLEDIGNISQNDSASSPNEPLSNWNGVTQTGGDSSLQYQPPSYEPTQALSTGSHLSASNNPTSSFATFQLPAVPSAEGKAQSFVNQSKDGYKSPYDLPESLARPRKQPGPRRSMQTLNSAFQTPAAAPVRSSSVAATTEFSNSLAPNYAVPPPSSNLVPPPKTFYEELPIPKQRPSSSGRYAPRSATALSEPPSLMPAQALPTAQPFQPQPIITAKNENIYQSLLQAPAVADLPSDISAASATATPAASLRYSPKPPTLAPGKKPQADSRYSAVPPPPLNNSPVRNRYVSQPAATLPFQPRTSSPLAQHEKNAYTGSSAESEQEQPSTSTFHPPRRPSSQLAQELPLPTQNHELAPSATICEPPLTETPSTRYTPNPSLSQIHQSPTEAAYSSPSLNTHARSPPTRNDAAFAPPRRSQTQSPGRQTAGPIFAQPITEPFQRPASVHAPGSPTRISSSYIGISTASREPIQQLVFVPPTDGQQFDPLERWKGAPVFKFGFGGLVATCWPQHVPRYEAGQMIPIIKALPGEPKVKHSKDIIPSVEDIVHFPGPLRSKSKKKDVIAWLSSKIAAFENEANPSTISPVDSYKRHEEKVLLWRIVRILVEYDGALEGTPEIQKAIRAALSPGLQSDDGQADINADPTGPGVYHPQNASVKSDGVDPEFLLQLKNDLLRGDRDKAVWSAVDRRLWGHAMLLSSTLDRSIWKQVIQEFVRREVRSAGDNLESLAALYEVFAGNMEESVDELVPPSTRAGLQLMSKSSEQAQARNALAGLDRWRDTVGLVMSNRSTEDYRALLNLGQLLLHYGRVEAAHICFLFARASSQTPVFGGLDDPQSNIVLLGVDHHHFPLTFANDEDAVALTEVYEFATSILPGHTGSVLPHLQAFKVLHATCLVEKGLKSEAQQYCDAVSAILKASTRPSPYHHTHLLAELEELAARVRQAPSDGSSSWISKPSMEKVSGSMWAKFNSFIAGDDSDAASNGSGKIGDGDVGPFAKVTGTPTISRPPSASEPYSSYPIAQPISGAASRYAPVNQHSLSTSPEQNRGRSSFEQQMSPPMNISYGARRGSQESHTSIEGSSYFPTNLSSQGSPSAFFYQSTPPNSSYTPLAPVEEDSTPQPSQAEPLSSQFAGGLLAHRETVEQPVHTPSGNEFMSSETGIGESTMSSYEPPTSSYGYEPPSYEPDLPVSAEDGDEPAEEKKHKKKSFMDDDDDDGIATRAGTILKAEKTRKDREADEVFRKAAEADAQRAQQAPAKKGWFGGWFGGKKEGEPPGPIRAKLGEENSFYYDKELKKWVNKKDPNSGAASVRATPPPPKGPPSRITTPAPLPPTGSVVPALSSEIRPQSSSGIPSLTNGINPPASLATVPPRAASTIGMAAPPPLGSTSGSGGPPRPTTSLSQASSIDDLIGAPQARKGNTIKGKKKGRGYVDVMAS